MKRTVASGLLLFVLVGLGTGVLRHVPPAASAQPQPEVQFVVTGVGRVNLEPDFALVVFSVQSISKTAQVAISENAKAVEELVKQLRVFLRPGDRIETAGFRLGPDRGGFVVVNQVQVRTLQVKEIGRLIDAAVRAGADDVAGVAFGREHTREAAQRAVREAMQQARESAEAVAAGLGLRVLRVTHIEPSLGQVEGPLALEQYARRGNDTPIQRGQLTLTAQVRMHYMLGP